MDRNKIEEKYQWDLTKIFKNTVHRISKYCEKLDNFMVKGRNKVSQILKIIRKNQKIL